MRCTALYTTSTAQTVTERADGTCSFALTCAWNQTGAAVSALAHHVTAKAWYPPCTSTCATCSRSCVHRAIAVAFQQFHVAHAHLAPAVISLPGAGRSTCGRTNTDVLAALACLPCAINSSLQQPALISAPLQHISTASLFSLHHILAALVCLCQHSHPSSYCHSRLRTRVPALQLPPRYITRPLP